MKGYSEKPSTRSDLVYRLIQPWIENNNRHSVIRQPAYSGIMSLAGSGTNHTY